MAKGEFSPSVAAAETGPNTRLPFSSSTRALVGLVADWTSLAKNEVQGFSSESSRPERSHELQTPETLGGRTWAKWALPLGLFAGLVRQSASLWVVVLWCEHQSSPPPSALLSVRLRLIWLMSASLLVVPMSASSTLVMGCLEVGAVVLVVAELVAVVTIYLPEVSPRRLHGDATFRDTS